MKDLTQPLEPPVIIIKDTFGERKKFRGYVETY